MTADIRPVTAHFATAPQLAPEDMAEAAARGFALVINNRPDGEAPGQPSSAQMEAAARAAGLDYRWIPVVGGPTPDQVAAVKSAVDEADGPTLAFCRSGTRSIVSWARGRAGSDMPREELVELGRAGGYDLSGAI